MRSLTLAIGLCTLISFQTSLLADGCSCCAERLWEGFYAKCGCSKGLVDYTMECGCGNVEPSCGSDQTSAACGCSTTRGFWPRLSSGLCEPRYEPCCGVPTVDTGCADTGCAVPTVACQTDGCAAGGCTGNFAPIANATELNSYASGGCSSGCADGLAPVVNGSEIDCTGDRTGILSRFACRTCCGEPGAGYVPGVSTCGVDGNCLGHQRCGLTGKLRMHCGCGGYCDGCGVQHCGMPAPNYPVPYETPSYVGETQFTYPPMMPHHSLPHYRHLYAFRHGPGMARTTVNWRKTHLMNIMKRAHHMVELPR